MLQLTHQCYLLVSLHTDGIACMCQLVTRLAVMMESLQPMHCMALAMWRAC